MDATPIRADAALATLADPSRRSVLASAVGIVVATALADWSSVVAAAAAPAAAGTSLSAADAADVEAITAQIVPTDDTPGAREAGVVHFVDRALATFFSAQAAVFLAGLGDFRARYAAAYPARGAFATWSSAEQYEYLATVDQTPFFTTLRDLTVVGLLCKPEYGGNRDGIGWRMIGFVDEHAFQPPFGYYDRDYPGFSTDGSAR
jgi:gluconate 2-dehydrogenase gamma chain